MIVYDKYSFNTNREIDPNGFLRVEMSNITKAQIRPYLGREIPSYKDFNLDPNKVYNVLCPKEELEKAAKTFNNLPLTREHIEVDVDDVPKEKIVGSLGDHATVDGGYLKNNLIIYDKKDIDLVLSGKKKELSCGYRYTPVQESGEYEGQHYDFKMTDIVGNHVALVKQGRAGRDVMVADSSKGLLETMKEKIIAVFDNDLVEDAEEKKEEVEWITVKGNHIPVGKGQSKEEAVKSFIEGKKDGGSEKKSNQKKPELYVSTENDENGQYYTVKAKAQKKRDMDIPLKRFDTQKEAFEYKDEMDKKFDNMAKKIDALNASAFKEIEEEESSKKEDISESAHEFNGGHFERYEDFASELKEAGFEDVSKYGDEDEIIIEKDGKKFRLSFEADFEQENNKNKYNAKSINITDVEEVKESKKEEIKGNEEYIKRGEEAKKEFPDFDVASPEEFKELTGLSPAEFEKKYPVKEKESSKEDDYISIAKKNFNEGDVVMFGRGHEGQIVSIDYDKEVVEVEDLDEDECVKVKLKKLVEKNFKNGKSVYDADMSKQEKVGVVMKEFKEGELKSGSGEKVTDPKQAIAIALSEADKVAKDEIPEKAGKPEKAGEENALQQGEKKMAEEVKEEVKTEEKVETTPAEEKPVEDACSKDAEIKKESEEEVIEDEEEKDDLKGKEKKAFAEGVDYGEKKEKEEPKKLDSEHESEGAKKADEEEKEEKKEEMAKDTALVMDADALRAEGREQAMADFKARDCARKSVRSIVGDVDIFAFDSAEDIYKFACKEAGMNLDEIVSFKDAFAGLQAGKMKLALDASPVSGSNEECFKNIRLA